MGSERKNIGAVMVVGGGIAGIQASLDMAELGYLVYLVESSPDNTRMIGITDFITGSSNN